MRIQIKTTNITLTDSLSEYLHKRLSTLEKFFGGSDEAVQIDVELARTTKHHQSGDIFRAEFNVHMGKQTFRAVKETSDMYASIDEAKAQMEDELRGFKGKSMHMLRRGGQRVKDMLRGITRWGRNK